MIGYLRGTLIGKEIDKVAVMTQGGVGYEVTIPLNVYESLPKLGDDITLHTYLVVREDEWLLFGFANLFEKRVFARLLRANGVGPSLAIGMLSTLSAERLVRAIRERDFATLQGVPRVGRKKAERIVLDLADSLDDVQVESATGAPRSEAAGVEDAVRALVSLGYAPADAEKSVRVALDDGGRGLAAPALIRLALNKTGGR